MVRVVLVVTYLATAALAVALVDANTQNIQLENAAIVLWYCAAASMVFYAWFIGAGSAVLIVVSALARMVADGLRRPRVEG